MSGRAYQALQKHTIGPKVGFGESRHSRKRVPDVLGSGACLHPDSATTTCGFHHHREADFLCSSNRLGRARQQFRAREQRHTGGLGQRARCVLLAE